MRSGWLVAMLAWGCSEGRGASGTGGGAASGGAGGSLAAGASSAGGTGGVAEVPGCNTEGVCRVYSGEICGVCPDCPLDIPECGACGADAACGTDDACTCDVCDAESQCGPGNCIDNGVCVYFDEGCACADCASDPLCAR